MRRFSTIHRHRRGAGFSPRGLPNAFLRVLPIGALLICALLACDDETETGQPLTSQPAAVEEVARTAENGPLKVTVTAERGHVEIPEPVKLTIHIEAEAGIEVGVPKLEGFVGNFGVKDMAERDVPCGDYYQCKQWTYTLDTFLPGVQEIPPLTFSFRDPREKADGSKTVYEDTVSTEPLAINVVQSLADIKAPVGLDAPFQYRLLGWAAGVIVVMALIALGARWLMRSKWRSAVQASAPMTPPHIWALGELDKLMQEDLIGRGLIQEFYYRINSLLRRYIELRFNLMAGEQTSEEFIRALQHSHFLTDDHKDLLRQFVAACDPVKYALHRPDADEIEWVQASARRFILQTAPAAPAQIRQTALQQTPEAVA